MSAPNGMRTPSLSRVRDGLLISTIDLNLIRQVRDSWGFQVSFFYLIHLEYIEAYKKSCFQMTQRLEMYAEELAEVCKPDYKQQIIRN